MRICVFVVIASTAWLSLISAVQDEDLHDSGSKLGKSREKSLERRLNPNMQAKGSRTISRNERGRQAKVHGPVEQDKTAPNDVHVTSSTTGKSLRKHLTWRGGKHLAQADTAKRDRRQFVYGQSPYYRPDAERRIMLFHRLNENGPCSTNFCHHGGQCIPRARHGAFCSCPFGYIGARCEVKTECKSDSCKNGGTCTEMAMGRHLCTCAVGYRGDDCEEISRCHPNPCRNGGTCSETDESFVCLCPEGYKGKTCTELNKCSPNPCKNKGTCFELNDDFVCNCPQGFKGKICQVISECSSVYCLNGGTCRDEQDGYKCDCPYGFSGKRCEASACHPNPCKNDGVCLKFGAKSSCQCKLGYFGRRCEESSPCRMNLCQNDGTCVDGTNTNSRTGFACLCQPGYDGILCEKHLRSETTFQGSLDYDSN